MRGRQILRVAVAVVLGNERLPRGVAQQAEGYVSGFTEGDMERIGSGNSVTRDDCLQQATRDGRFCAVNFRPADPDQGNGLGMCVGVLPPCDAGGVSSQGLLTARISTRTAHAPPTQPTPPPARPPRHHAGSMGNNACHAMQAYTAGFNRGTEREIQASGVSQADCVESQDYAETPYCAVNFYPQSDQDTYIPSGACMGVLPPCGEIAGEPVSGASFTAVLPIDKSGDCTWHRQRGSSSPPAPPPGADTGWRKWSAKFHTRVVSGLHDCACAEEQTVEVTT